MDNTVVDRKPDGDVHREGKGKRHGPVAEAFRTYIMAHKTEIAERHFNWLQ